MCMYNVCLLFMRFFHDFSALFFKFKNCSEGTKAVTFKKYVCRKYNIISTVILPETYFRKLNFFLENLKQKIGHL